MTHLHHLQTPSAHLHLLPNRIKKTRTGVQISNLDIADFCWHHAATKRLNRIRSSHCEWFEPMAKKILIAGAGIGGLTAASLPDEGRL